MFPLELNVKESILSQQIKKKKKALTNYHTVYWQSQNSPIYDPTPF